MKWSSQKYIRWAAAGAVAVFAYVVLAGASTAAPVYLDSLVYLDPCTVDCLPCGPGEHSAPTGTMDQPGPGSHNNCHAGTCCYQGGGGCVHSECHISFNEREYRKLLEAWDSRNMRLVASMIASKPSAFQVNADRSSVQVVGCNSAVIANLPLAPAQLSEVLN